MTKRGIYKIKKNSFAVLTVAIGLAVLISNPGVSANAERQIASRGKTNVVRVKGNSASSQIRLKNFKTRSRLSASGGLIIESFSAELGGGRIAGQGTINLSEPEGAHNVRIRLEKVDLAELAREFKLPLGSVLPGHVSGQIDARWTGVGFESVAQTLDGKASLRFGPGSFNTLEALDELADYTGIADLREMTFDQGQAKLQAKKGQLTIELFSVVGDDEALSANGTVNLATEDLKIGFEVSVAPEVALNSRKEQVRAAVPENSSEFVKLNVPVMIAGTLADPKAEYDLSRVDLKTAASFAASFMDEHRKGKDVQESAPQQQPEKKKRVLQVVQDLIGS